MSAAGLADKFKTLTFSNGHAAETAAEAATVVTAAIADEEAPLNPYATVTRVLDELVRYHSSPLARPTATAENIILFTSSVAQLGNEIAASVTAATPEDETYFTMAAKTVPALANGAAQLKGFYTRAKRIQSLQEAIIKHIPVTQVKALSCYSASEKKIIGLDKPATQEGILKELNAKGNLYLYIQGVEEPLIFIDYSIFTFKNGIKAWLATIPLIVTLLTSLLKILNPEAAANFDNPAARTTGIIASTVPMLSVLEKAREYAYTQEINVLQGYRQAMNEVYLKPGKLDQVREDFLWPLQQFLSPESMIELRKAIEAARDKEMTAGISPARPQFG